jgi:hypothetical protein
LRLLLLHLLLLALTLQRLLTLGRRLAYG